MTQTRFIVWPLLLVYDFGTVLREAAASGGGDGGGAALPTIDLLKMDADGPEGDWLNVRGWCSFTVEGLETSL